MIARILFSSIVLLLAMTGAAFSQPKRVLIVHSVGRDFSPWDDYARKIREELRLQSKDPIDIFEASLSTARFPDGNEDPFVNYLNAVFSERKLDLIMTIGGPAAQFFQQNRQRIFPSDPNLVRGRCATDVFERTGDRCNGFGNCRCFVHSQPDFEVASGDNQALHRDRKFSDREAMAGGDAQVFQPLTSRSQSLIPMNCRWNRSSSRWPVLPPRLFIVYGQMLVDAAGVVHEGGRPLDRIHAVANAPIFSEQDVFFGQGSSAAG